MDHSKLYSLDIETAPEEKTDSPYALEPFRLRQGKAYISSIAVSGPDGYIRQVDRLSNNMDEMYGIFQHLKGKKVVCHNTIFDVAWMIERYGLDKLRGITWLDTYLLAKWLLNSQTLQYGKLEDKLSLSLAGLVEHYLVGHPLYEDFLDVKSRNVTAGEDYEYWLQRGKMDALLTRDLYIKLIENLASSQYRGYMIEQKNILPVANSWVTGIDYDEDRVKTLLPKIKKAKAGLASKLNKPEAMFTSPKQIGTYLFDELGLPPAGFTPKGAPSTSADNLKMMAMNYAGSETGDIIRTILDFKQVKTLESKFINGLLEVGKYVGTNKIHAAPRMFGTYTGRFTYSSMTLNKPKYRISIATHQLPRKGPTRRLLVPPEGYVIGELDAAAQEMRGMALESRDQHMIDAFNIGMNLHSSMGAYIQGENYDVFEEKRKLEDEETYNFRQAGKLLNLSCQYRIGAPALASKFFTTYGIVISKAQASSYLSLYKRRYVGVVDYWKSAVTKAYKNGFAETVGGRRYYIDNWKGNKWGSESSAINFPIQGFGADHKNVAIAALFNKFPEAIFVLDLHDGLWYYLPKGHAKELLLEMKHYLNTEIDYSSLWQTEVPVPLLFDAQIGNNFMDVHEI